MTDNTQPEALRLADEVDEVARTYPDMAEVSAELRRQHSRIAELEAQLEAIGAGGVSGPLMGKPQEMPDLTTLTERGAKAWAGVDAQGLREGVSSADGWLHENGLLYRLTDERHPRNRDEINVTMADGSRSIESRSRRALELLDRIRATHPSPPEGMVGGWIALPGALPEPGTPVLLDIGKKYPIRAMWAAKHTVQAADDDTDWGEYDEATDTYYCPEGWYEWNEHEDTNWAVSATPRAWAPLPPTTSAGSGKGE